MLFARCFHAEVTTTAAVLLVLAVWLIYAADRIFDSRGGSHLPRHEFYRRNWKRVAPVWLTGLAMCGYLAFANLSRELFERGVLLAAAVALYFALVHLAPLKTWPKEAAVAILFALGASLAAWAQVKSVADVATILVFSALCWINCVAIEKWELRNPRWPVGRAAAGVAIAAILLLIQHRPVLGSAEAASALAFVLLDRGRERISRDALRVLADVALLSPVFFLPIAGTLA